MAEILILSNNKYCQINLDDDALLKKLDKLLSYKEPGIEFSPAYQRFGWNGVNHLLVRGKFPIGLLEMVKTFLVENKVEFSIIDQRPEIIMADPIDISGRLKELGMVPRYYQIDTAKAALKHRQGIIKSCTGSGKTLSSAIITAALNKPTVIFVIGLDLLQQFHDLFSKIFNEEIGYVGNGICDIKRISIVSLWTAAKSFSPKKKIKILEDDEGDDKEKFDESNIGKIQEMIKSARLIMFDECHSGSTASFKAIYSKISPEYLYGLSGTPYKLEETDLLIKALLGNVIVDIKASELIAKNYLIQPTIKFLYVPKLYVENKTYQGIYKEYIVDNQIRNKMVINSTKKLVEAGYQVLVLFRQIAHGKGLMKMLNDSGVEAEMLSGKDKVAIRSDVKDKLLSGKLRCIVASSIFDIGVDISSLNALVLASPNKSVVRTLQRVGRVIRPFPGKVDVKIVDFYDDIMYLKAHSKRRYQIYKQEIGFIILPLKDIKL